MADTWTKKLVIGTRTGRVTHLSTDMYGITGHTMCGKWVKDPTKKPAAEDATCEKCRDARDLDVGSRTHHLSISARDDREYVTGTCTCGWETYVMTSADGEPAERCAVDQHHAHILRTVRGA